MEKLKHFVERHKFRLSLAGFILSTCWAVYTYISPYEQLPNLVIYQKSTSDVFTQNEPLRNEGLQVYLGGKDIQKSGLNLKIYKLKLINNGEKDISSSDFDQNSVVCK